MRGGVEQTECISRFVLLVSKSLILLKNRAFLFSSFPTILPYIVSRIRAENLPDIYHSTRHYLSFPYNEPSLILRSYFLIKRSEAFPLCAQTHAYQSIYQKKERTFPKKLFIPSPTRLAPSLMPLPIAVTALFAVSRIF